MRSVETVLLLVVLGTVIAVFAGRLQIPAPSMLVVAGLLIGLLPGVPAVRVPRKWSAWSCSRRCFMRPARNFPGGTCGPCGGR